MDLQTISSQMRVVIQKHQIVVTEMRNDPQNPVLQKRLHDLQSEIHGLNERQKQVVDDLRRNFQINSSPFNSGFPISSHPPSPQVPNQEIRMVCTQKPNAVNHKTNTIKQLSNCINTVHQTVPPMNNIATPTATFTFKAPVGTVVLPNCSTASALLSSKAAEHQKLHPVLVVPSPSNRSADGPQAGVLLNLVPPIRVPQYPPPATPRPICPVTTSASQKMSPVTNCIPVTVAPIPNPIATSVTHTKPVGQYVGCSSSSPVNRDNIQINSTEKYQPIHATEKIINKIDQKKKEFMACLGLVTRDSLGDIKNKKLERKRRSTANPQFSNAALEEKLKIAAALQAQGPPLKRPRGRPRLDSKLLNCPTNGICSVTESLRNSDTNSPVERANSSSNALTNASTVNISTVVNGICKHNSNSEDAKNVEQMLSGLCIVCTQPGDLVKCDTCAKQQHPGCMLPPLVTRPPLPWQCSDCQSRKEALIVVPSYDMLKAAKEDEKRKLLKKSLELRLKRSQLEGRLIQLKELSSKQKSRQSELQTSLKSIEALLERIHNVINGVRLCS